MQVKMSISLLFFLLFLSDLSLSSSLDCNAADRTTLLNIKSELGNPPELSTWLPATNCCTWSNVYCSDTGRINNVYLFSLNISTTIPPSFGDLPKLETIQLQTIPGLYGTIPPSFSKLHKLEILFLTDTSVTGTIPDFLSRTNLSALDLHNNKFSGPIPMSLTKLPRLQFLDLSGNSFSGTIPPGLLHGTDRSYLYLARNKLSGEIPEDYGNGDIDTIDLSHNRLTGDPSFLFGLTKPMTKIDLSWNQLEFDMTRVAFPHHLNYLDLSHNRIKGKVPKSLQDVQLRFLNFSYNELCGELPKGRFMANYKADSYIHNKCLCGTPLPPCKP
ncbi:Polygalacturonase inhibitor 1 [Rhynchospora pubera]|uniref:Polygalacturonase inhibitor 1 n=1 Tax=Rhynchospora pubera TaxID=906938 RepID=A0AAV8DCB0_9POAL|nr:Polygalacturonase inhibitor 1 [Rhynchospora pubera]